jgi:transposase-like protein
MSENPDWEAIRSEYESSSITFKDLATKHGVAVTTLYNRSRKWSRNSKIPNSEEKNSESKSENSNELSSDPSAAKGAKEALNDLLELIKKSKGKMSFVDHQKASNAIAQYNDIIVNAVPELEQENIRVVTIDTRDMSVEMLNLLEEFTEKMRALEIQEGKRVG